MWLGKDDLPKIRTIVGQFSLKRVRVAEHMRLHAKWRYWLPISVALLFLLIAAAPRRAENGGCLFCGRSRYQAWFCGIKIKDRVQETAGSHWVDHIYPDHTNHIWCWSGTEHKRWGLGRPSIGCGGLGAGVIAQIYYLRSEFGEDCAREVLQRYHSELGSDRAQLHQWLKREFQRLFSTNENTSLLP